MSPISLAIQLPRHGCSDFLGFRVLVLVHWIQAVNKPRLFPTDFFEANYYSCLEPKFSPKSYEWTTPKWQFSAPHTRQFDAKWCSGWTISVETVATDSGEPWKFHYTGAPEQKQSWTEWIQNKGDSQAGKVKIWPANLLMKCKKKKTKTKKTQKKDNERFIVRSSMRFVLLMRNLTEKIWQKDRNCVVKCVFVFVFRLCLTCITEMSPSSRSEADIVADSNPSTDQDR